MNDFKFLVDTGASVSIIFSDKLDNKIIDRNTKFKINGIGGYTTSLGSACIDLLIQNSVVSHNFLVLDKFENSFDGVLGADFFKKHEATINYENFSISFWVNDHFLTVPLESSYDNDYTTIPSRCEIVKYFDCNCVEDCVVLPQNICEGVYVAGCIANPENNKIPVKLMNVTERDVQIKNFRPSIHSLNHYHVCKFDDNSLSIERADKVLDLINIENLNSEEKRSIEKICAKYTDIFHLESDKLSVTNVIMQNIILNKDTQPIYSKPYRLPYTQKLEVQKQINKMLENDIIEEAKSPWSSPVLIVPKKSDEVGDKKWRVVIDYRQLNKQIQDDKFPLPNINDILDSLAGAIYFSHLDLAQGYYQVEIDPQSRPITAFSTDKAQYQMKRLPMGLKISPSAFSRVMTIAMSGLNCESCFIYLDDLIIFGKNLREHNQNLIKVFERLRKVNLKLNPRKCEFLKKDLLYLGHIISAEGILPDPDKINIVKNYPIPKSNDEVKRFVAFVNYYRRFIKNFANIVLPLNILTRKNVNFSWTHECQNSFETLKQCLVNPPVLQFPNFSDDNQFVLNTDASGFAIGAVLSNSNNKVVAYASRSLNKAEKNYCTIEKELLAIVWAVKHFRPYLFGKRFKIFTDHKPLIYLFGMTNPSSRLTKFRLVLEEYDFEIQYVKGKDNVVADALSRITLDELKEISNNVIFAMTRSMTKNLPDHGNNTTTTEERTDHPGFVELLKRPEQSIELQPINQNEFEMLRNNKGGKNDTKSKFFIYDVNKCTIFMKQPSLSSTNLDASLKDLFSICYTYNIKEILIIKNDKTSLLIKELLKVKDKFKLAKINVSIVQDVRNINDKEMRQLILNDFHMLPTGGHVGIKRMFNNIKKYYFWPSLFKDVEHFIKKCDDCQRYKHSNQNREPMCLTDTATTAFERVFLDIVGPLNTDNDENKYILTIQCDLTKFVECYPIRNKEAETVAKNYVENFILRFGIPKIVVTDQGTEFMASVFQEICKLLEIKRLHSTAYHHQTLGAIENTHKHLGAYLRMQLNKYPSTWSTWVPYWAFSYNTTVHSSTDYSPFELVFGKKVNLPSNLLNQVEPIYNFDNYALELKYRLQHACQDARENIIKTKVKRNVLYNENTKESNYKVGDNVLVRNETGSKLDAIYNGPYKVVEVKRSNVVIKLENKLVELHKNRIKHYCE